MRPRRSITTGIPRRIMAAAEREAPCAMEGAHGAEHSLRAK